MKRLIAFALYITATSMSANAAVLLQFEGIEGDSTTRGFEGYIELEQFDWSVSASNSTTTGSGRTNTRTEFSDVSWIQVQDRSFVSLFDKIAKNEIIPEAEIVFTHSARDDLQAFFTMQFEDVQLTTLSLSADSSGEPVVSGAFAYSKILMEYQAYTRTGEKGETLTASYDLETGKGNLASLASVYSMALQGPTTSPVPLPAAAWLFASGLVILVGASRNRAAPQS